MNGTATSPMSALVAMCVAKPMAVAAVSRPSATSGPIHIAAMRSGFVQTLRPWTPATPIMNVAMTSPATVPASAPAA